MRNAVYALAAIAAAGIAYLFATAPIPGDAPSETVSSVTNTSHQVMPTSGSMTLQVDDMHCPFACYPAVKKTLEGQTGVVDVELAEQKVDGEIDNPQVLVKYEPGFDLTAAREALAKKGFAKSSVIE